jgi:hypothetical protein
MSPKSALKTMAFVAAPPDVVMPATETPAAQASTNQAAPRLGFEAR